MTTWTGTGTLISSPSGLGTTTRSALRREVCRELHMPFIRRLGSGYSEVDASPVPSTLYFCDDALAQEDNYWTGQWYYNIENEDVRKIVDFRAKDNKVVFEYPATTPVAGDKYEIHSVWNAFELHGAINRAIEDAFPAFFDYVTDETMIFKEKTLKYSLASLTYSPWIVAKIWAELSNTKIIGVATSATTTTLVDSRGKFGSVSAGWLVSIYDGTGVGQLRTVSTATSTSLTLVSNWTTIPDTTSKYAVWNPSDQTSHWEQVISASFDAKEFPSNMYLQKTFPESLGLRIRLEYSHKPSELSSETDLTAVPKEFIINKTLSILFGQKVNDNRADRNRYANLGEYYRQVAEQYRIARAFQPQDNTIWQGPKTLLAYSQSENPF